jgi:hypothetical protein
MAIHRRGPTRLDQRAKTMGHKPADVGFFCLLCLVYEA